MAFKFEDLLKMADPNAQFKFVKSLPPKIQTRTRALMGLEEEHKQLRTEMEAKIKTLEEKYAEIYKPLFEQRAVIIAGGYEMGEEEVKEGKTYLLSKAEKDEDSDDEPAEKPDIKTTVSEHVKKGIPDFWLTALTNHPAWNEQTEHEWDQPILKHLMNIECKNEPSGFQLIFTFSENKFFTNKTLTKTYKVEESDLDMDDVVEVVGDTIEWNEGQDVTTKTVKSKVKGKQPRIVSKSKTQESFFNFFKSVTGEKMQDDFELASYLKDQIIPRSVEWYCDEFAEDDDEEDEEGEEEEDEEEEDEESNDKADEQKNADCKQQ